MKAQQFADFLNDYALLLIENGAVDRAAAWKKLAVPFCARPTASVKDVCARIAAAETNKAGSDVRVLTNSIPALDRMLSGNAKKALIDDLGHLSKALQPHQSVSIDALVEAALAELEKLGQRNARRSASVREDVVARHLHNLERAFGDEKEFPAVFEILKNDKDVKTGEAKKIAKLFSKGTAKSKKHALELIWGRHASLMDGRASGKAIGNRTAA